MSATFAGLVLAVSEDVRAAHDELNRLDAVAGDGDLGVTMTAAADAVLALVDELGEMPPELALRRLGMEIASRAPSTAGTLMASALLAASRVDQRPEPPLGSVARRVAAAQEAIEARGHAKVGDKTMLDALGPVAISLEQSARDGLSLEDALARAATAAREGADGTRRLRATVGRAGWLADRSQGSDDAGARLVAIIAEAANRYVTKSAGFRAAQNPSDLDPSP
jgi:phosphoenolpyruvate---glycerone phosphotransferase subunit DhaL